MMQKDMRGSGVSERQSAESSARKSVNSRSIDTRRTLLTKAEYKVSEYLECRLSELRVRKDNTKKEMLSLYKNMIDNLMKDVDDFKIRVQNDEHVGASRQYFLDECLKFQRELQQPWRISLTEQQKCSSATKKQKVADPHETKSVPSKDPHVYNRPVQASGVVPVTSVEAHGHAQASTEKSTIQAFDPLINSQGLQTSSSEELQYTTSNTRQERVTNIDAGCKESQQAGNSKDTIIRVQAGSTQEVAIRDGAKIYIQHDVIGPHDTAITNSQQIVRTSADAHVATSASTTGRDDTATGRAVSDAGSDATAAAYSLRPIDRKDLPAVVDQSSIDLLLIGSCGNGKSATGNSILGRPAFRRTASSSVDSACSASSIKMESTECAGKVVNVIDGPSINVSGNITPDEVGKIIENVGKSLELCKCSFTALLIILKFGERFTKQEIEALRVIKAVLGKHVVREYGVCVITYGDGFEYSMEEARDSGEEMTFEGWLKEQKGEVTNLFKECNYRCVLFDNVTKDGEKRQAQLDKLMDILPKGKRYSQDAFLQAMHGTQELEMEASLPTFLKEAQVEADKIRELIDQHEEIKMHDPEARNIKLKLRELKEKVNNMRISSVELESLKMSLNVLESNLNMKLQRWEIERDIEMNRVVHGKTLARSSTAAMADQTTMANRKTPHDWDMAALLHFNKDIPAPSDFNKGMSASSNFNMDMAGPLDFATSIKKTGSSVDNSRHANTESMQGLPFNDNPKPTTSQIHETGITDQHSDPSVNIQSFVIVKKRWCKE